MIRVFWTDRDFSSGTSGPYLAAMSITAMGVTVPRDSLFFFQAEDGIRDLTVTGVQTCALPISGREASRVPDSGRTLATLHPSAPAQTRLLQGEDLAPAAADRCRGNQEFRLCPAQIGRASCRERV